jgi:hypothetical protein
MNDNLNNIKAKTQDTLQTLFEYLDNNSKSKDIEDLREKIDTLSITINNLISQTDKIIEQNNEILNKISALSISEKISFNECTNSVNQEEKIAEEPVSVSPKQEELVKEEPKIKEEETVLSQSETDPTKQEEELPKQEVELPKQEIEEPKQEEEAKQQEVSAPTTEEQPQKTTSVLEFLHKRVIKDNPVQETTIPQTETPQQETDIKPTQSHIQNLTEQIKSEAKLQSNGKTRSIADQFEEKNNRDLSSAIGVSEKFMFINDLFSGNVKEYDTFVKNLNGSASYDESMNIVLSMQAKKRWVKNSVAYTTLENMITKRFE